MATKLLLFSKSGLIASKKRVCQFVAETNKPDFLTVEIPDNPKLNQKIRSYASVANWQTDVFRVIKPDFEELEDSVVNSKTTTENKASG